MTMRQNKQSWNKGRADALTGKPARCASGLDRLPYQSGYVEGRARRQVKPNIRFPRASE
jgi:hypothetical protein